MNFYSLAAVIFFPMAVFSWYLMVSHKCPIGAVFNWVSKEILDFLVLLNFALWLAKKTRAVLSTNQIQNYKLRFKQFACFHFDFSLACDDVIDSRWDYFSFGFSTSIVKLLLYKTEINQPTDVSTVVFYCKFLS